MSTYREERDALRARAEGLEQELAEVRGELADAQGALDRARQSDQMERIEQLERDLAAAQRALGEIRARVAPTQRPPPPRQVSGAAVVASVMGLILVGAGAGMFLLTRSAAPPPPPRIEIAPPPALEPQPEAPPPQEPAPVAIPAESPGFLTVACDPQCEEVLVDGRRMGTSPLVRVAVPPGKHKLDLRAGDQRKTLSVIVVSGQTTAQRVRMR